MSVLKNIIGQGGFGTVYGIDELPSVCVKVSNKKNNCRAWSDEYKKLKKIHSILDTNKSYKNLKFVRIIEPLHYYEKKDGNCFMVLNRIYNPYEKKYMDIKKSKSYATLSRTRSYKLSKSSKSPISPSLELSRSVSDLGKKYKNIDNYKNDLTIHSLFGEIGSETYKSSLRGKFIGLDLISTYLTDSEIEKISYELGQVMALLHFVAKNDATDIELYLGREFKTKKPRIYISDFDMSNDIIDYDDDTIDKLCWCFQAMPYFPSTSSSDKLYELFKEGYRKIANNDEVVEKIFDCYS